MSGDVMQWGDTRLPTRFWDKVVPEPNGGCWLWTASSTTDGYGQWDGGILGQSRLVHRTTYAVVATIPDGFDVDHKCRVRCCCNPAHLDAVTHLVNTLRGHTIAALNAAKTECPKGHAFAPGNIYIERRRRDGKIIGKRCRRCKLDQQNASRRAQ